MYLSFYGLAEKPFSQTPDPKFLYWNDGYRETIASLRYGIQERKGFVTMIGEAGTGKTTLLRKLLDDLGPDVVSVFLFNPNATFEEILEYTLSELGIPATTGRKLAMLQRLNDFLLAAFNEGKTTILLIDEAQDLETEVLESLRLLSNLETSKEKILQIVLSGQPELAARLAQPNLRQLKQRIAVRCRLEPLGRHELAEYIAARLAVAGGRPDLFAPDTLDPIWDFARGIPRLINTVCDNALLVGYALGRQTIDRGVVGEVVADLARIDVLPGDVAPAPAAAAPAAAAPAPAMAPAAPAAAPAPAATAAPPPAAAAAPAAEPRPAPAPPAPPQAPRRAEPAADRARPASGRKRRGMRWAVAVLLVVLAAAAALAAGNWATLEPRLASLLERRPVRDALPLEPRPARDALPPDALERSAALPAAARPAPPREATPPAPAPHQAIPEPEPAPEPATGAAAEPAAEPAAAPAPVAERALPAAPETAAPTEAAPRPRSAEPAAAGVGDEATASRARPEAAPAAAPAGEAPAEAARAPDRDAPGEPGGVAAVAPRAPGATRQDLQATGRRSAPGRRVLVQRGDTLMNLANREYGVANYTTLDVLRAANPGIEDVNRIIAGSEILFPDPGPGSRVLDARDGVSVLVVTTPALGQAQELQRLIGTRYRLPADLEPVVLGDGRSLYRVSLRRVPSKAQALQIAEALGPILQDPS